MIYQYHGIDNHPPKPPARRTDYRENFLSVVNDSMVKSWSSKRLPEEGQYFIAWDIILVTYQPHHSWRILIDAMTGGIIQVIDLFQYATGSGRVYDPNPIVTSGNTGR